MISPGSAAHEYLEVAAR